MPRAVVIRAPGTNCDAEMVRAFTLAGAACDLVHLDALIARPERLAEYDLIGFAGGFSYGDDIASGRVFAVRMKQHLYPALRQAAERGVLMIGACNGFQVLVQAGLLPGPDEAGAWPAEPAEQETALTFNAGGRFVDRWLRMEPEPASVCVWTKGLAERFGGTRAEQAMWLPIAHGEGRFVARSPAVLERLRRHGQIAIRYAAEDNVNGSEDRIAGICDRSGRIFGLMPHPERYLEWNRHPWWTRLDAGVTTGPTPGLMMFASAVAAARLAAAV
jgi:phosphoribosylformylglycinamidine synthase I